jgi:hypothetical protein
MSAASGRCLNHHPDAITMLGDLDDVEAVQADEDIATLAVGLAGGRIWARARTIARRRPGHRRGLPG